MQVTADVMVRDARSSAGYWDIVRDTLADLVDMMLVRCYDEKNYPLLYQHVRDMRGQVWLCAFPTLFITSAPVEWTFHGRISGAVLEMRFCRIVCHGASHVLPCALHLEIPFQ